MEKQDTNVKPDGGAPYPFNKPKKPFLGALIRDPPQCLLWSALWTFDLFAQVFYLSLPVLAHAPRSRGWHLHSSHAKAS